MGRSRLQDGRTLPNPKRAMYGLYRKAEGQHKPEQYLLSVDAAQWHTMCRVRNAIKDGLLERLASENSSSWSVGLSDERSASGVVGFGGSGGFLSTISRESFASSRGLLSTQDSRAWSAPSGTMRCEIRRFFSTFPMFVPSLSWQNDRLYIYTLLKKGVFRRSSHVAEGEEVRI